MRTFLARLLVVAVTWGWAGCAYSQPSFLGSDGIKADVSDPSAFPPSDHVGTTILPVGSSDQRSLSARAGSGTASGDVSYLAKPGLLSVYANAGAVVGGVGNSGFPRKVAAGAMADASAIMVDEWNFEFDRQTSNIFVFAKFNLSGNLTTTADGVNGTPANGRQDEIDAHAIATLFVHGDGIADGPYLSHGPRDIWGYFEEGVLSLTINPHIRENPPATIPVALLFPGGSDKASGIVAWTLGVRAEVTVDDADVINHQAGSAIAIADFAHTLSWGGITSVTDADTGQPITNYTLTSASGFDYTHPFAGPIPEPGSVPEPSSIGLLASCLALMLLWRSGVARHH